MTRTDDPVLNYLLKIPSGLRAGGPSAHPEILVTYWTTDGGTPFAISRDALILRPGSEAPRVIPFLEVENAGYYNREMVERAKTTRRDHMPRPLTITLLGGETIDLPMNVDEHGKTDLLTIAGLIQKYAVLARARQRRATAAQHG